MNDNVLNLAEASLLFRSGSLKSFVLEKSVLSEGWNISFRLSDGNIAYLCAARNREIRVFRSLTAAIRTVERIGFSVTALTHPSH